MFISNNVKGGTWLTDVFLFSVYGLEIYFSCTVQKRTRYVSLKHYYSLDSAV